MKVLLFLSFVALSLADCPSGMVYNQQFNKCYKYVAQPSAYFLAEQDCSSIGGHLVSIHSGFENALIAENAQNIFGAGSFWIGANQVMTSSWGWTDGSDYAYTAWAQVHPFARMVISMSAPLTSVLPQLQSPAQLNHVLIGDAFNDAESTCIASSAHLASIHSSEENTFVAELAATGLTLDWSQMTWLGMHKVNGQWANLDGSAVDYYNWAPGQPDNDKGDENCIQLLQDELSGKGHANYRMGWNDIICSESLRAFACKKPALH